MDNQKEIQTIHNEPYVIQVGERSNLLLYWIVIHKTWQPNSGSIRAANGWRPLLYIIMSGKMIKIIKWEPLSNGRKNVPVNGLQRC